jgi:recombination protein RecA
LLDLGVAQAVIEKSGSWYSYGGERIGQGRDNARAYLEEHRDLLLELEGELRRELGLPDAAGAVQAAQSA